MTSSAYLFGGTLQGGAGGAGLTYSGSCASCPATMPAAPDGSGIARDPGSQLTLLDVDVSSLDGTGPTTFLSGEPGTFRVSTPLAAGDPVTVSVTGPAGHEVFVLLGISYEPAFQADASGVIVVPVASATLFLGSLPGSGSMTVELPLDLLAGREQAEALFLQALLRDPVGGTNTLGAPSALVQHRDPCR